MVPASAIISTHHDETVQNMLMRETATGQHGDRVVLTKIEVQAR